MGLSIRNRIMFSLVTYRFVLFGIIILLVAFLPTEYLYLPINIIGLSLFSFANIFIYVGAVLINGLVYVFSYLFLLIGFIVVEIIIWPINGIITLINAFSIPSLEFPDLSVDVPGIGEIDIIDGFTIWGGFSGLGLPLMSNPINLGWAITSLIGVVPLLSWAWLHGSTTKSLLMYALGL